MATSKDEPFNKCEMTNFFEGLVEKMSQQMPINEVEDYLASAGIHNSPVAAYAKKAIDRYRILQRRQERERKRELEREEIESLKNNWNAWASSHVFQHIASRADAKHFKKNDLSSYYRFSQNSMEAIMELTQKVDRYNRLYGNETATMLTMMTKYNPTTTKLDTNGMGHPDYSIEIVEVPMICAPERDV